MESTSTSSFFLVLAIVMLLNHVSFGQNLREKALPLLNECQKSVGASDEDVQLVLSKKKPTTHEGLCLIECVFEKANIMKDGKLDKEGAVKSLGVLMDGNTEKLEKFMTMMDLCEKEIGGGDGDKCKTADLLADCINKHGKEFGYEFTTSQ